MLFSLTEDFKTMKEVEKEPRAVLEQVQNTGRPVVVTVAGKPSVVIMDAETFERNLNAYNLGMLLKKPLEDIREGRTKPLDDVMKEMLGAKKISSRNRRNGTKRRPGNP